jgi:hypothetical protein
MGQLTQPSAVLPILAAFSRRDAALDWAQKTASASWGETALSSDRFTFTETDYYTASMGGDLRKCFFAFERLVDPGELPAIKRLTNRWENDYAESANHPESRPLNLDPGYITPAKLVLATTKDHAHRLYLGEGIFAEVTLSFRGGNWQSHPWTYPDYQREDFQQFFTQCRDFLRQVE